MATKNNSYGTLPSVQRATLEYLRDFIAHNGYAPTLKEISQHIQVKSLSTAHFHLERLEEKGFIKRDQSGVMQLIDLDKPEIPDNRVPLVGVIAAGVPIEAISSEATEHVSYIEVPSSMLGSYRRRKQEGSHDVSYSNVSKNNASKNNILQSEGDVFCLEVSGDSMIEAHICNGDIVVIRKQSTAENGQIIAAMLDDGSVTLKTYRRLKNGQVMLMPANSNMKPITLDNVDVLGLVIGVMRMY
jgi:repressor LexA